MKIALSARKDRIIIASTCRRSVQFGRYIARLWIANYISVTLPSFVMGDEPGKCHDVRAHKPEAVSDVLNPLSLGTMSASAYTENLA